MDFKLGRNDLCWCGSGKKYKFCHLNREREPSPLHQEVIQQFHQAFDKKYCLHPSANLNACQGKIIKAHTIQLNGGLNLIARNSHVYKFFGDFTTLKRTSGKLEARLIGIKNASTFTGFCSYHDNVVFSPLEKHPFQPTLEQIFLLSYRPICRELFTKRAALATMPYYRTIDRGKPLSEQISIQTIANSLTIGTEIGLKDIEYQKSLYDDVLIKGDFSPVRYYMLKLNTIPDIMCSGALFFDIDFAGNVLQDFSKVDQRKAGFAFSIIGSQTGGSIVFSWLNDSVIGNRFIRSLDMLSNTEIPHAIVRFVFEFFENTYFAPDWWESLTQEQQECLRHRLNLAVDPLAERKADSLLDDGLKVVNWEIQDRVSNLPL